MTIETQVADLTVATTNLTSAVITQQAALDTRIQNIIGAAPAALDTLAEIAAQLASDEDAAGVLTSTIALKADQATTYTKTQVDTALALKEDMATTYSKVEVDAVLATKANQSTTYTRAEVDSNLALKANQSTTYTKAEVDADLLLKANQATTYTKAEVDAGFAARSNQVLQKILIANYTLLASDADISFIIENGTEPITVTIPSGLPTGMRAGFIQQGTGTVTFAPNGTVLNSPYNMFKIKGQNYGAYIEQIQASNVYQILGKMKS